MKAEAGILDSFSSTTGFFFKERGPAITKTLRWGFVAIVSSAILWLTTWDADGPAAPHNSTGTATPLGEYHLAEARLGPFWANTAKKPSGHEFKVAARAANKAAWVGRFFPNCHPHALRILGRVAFASGRPNNARRYFDKSIEAATKLGAHYDLSRALLDSALAFPELEDRRQQGEQLLSELGAVNPEIEREQFPG